MSQNANLLKRFVVQLKLNAGYYQKTADDFNSLVSEVEGTIMDIEASNNQEEPEEGNYGLEAVIIQLQRTNEHSFGSTGIQANQKPT